MRQGYVRICFGGQGHWDDEVIEYVAGSREEAWRVRGWLGDIHVSGGRRRVATVSSTDIDLNLVGLLF